jgi:hypothetical protein
MRQEEHSYHALANFILETNVMKIDLDLFYDVKNLFCKKKNIYEISRLFLAHFMMNIEDDGLNLNHNDLSSLKSKSKN